MSSCATISLLSGSSGNCSKRRLVSRGDSWKYFRWSYLINLNLIGNAVYLSMDFPDTILAVSFLHACFENGD